MAKKKIYFASPYGFAESTRYFMFRVLLPLMEKHFEVLNPWTMTSEEEIAEAVKDGREKEFAMEIGKRNRVAIEEADLVMAAIDGQEVDSGVAAEIGFAACLGKKIIGYRNDFRKSGEGGVLVSLQVHYFIESSGGKITTNLDELETELSSSA